MNRRIFTSSIMGIAAAVSLQCFGIKPIAKWIRTVCLQQKTEWVPRGASEIPPIWALDGKVQKTWYRVAPEDFRDESEQFPACSTPKEAFESAGLPCPEGWANEIGYDRTNWVHV